MKRCEWTPKEWICNENRQQISTTTLFGFQYFCKMRLTGIFSRLALDVSKNEQVKSLIIHFRTFKQCER